MTETRTALLLGATGLVGRFALDRLLADPAGGRVTALVRRATGVTHEKLSEVVLDFDRLAEQKDAVRGDDVFICLGTTIKAAGSQEAFRKIDHDLVLEVARLARANGATRLAYVSSVDADPGALAFYLRTKGEVERGLAGLGYEQVEVLRPSFLVGERRERRPAEALGIPIARATAGLMLGPFRKYRPIHAEVVARGLVGSLRKHDPGVHVSHFDEITAFAAT